MNHFDRQIIESALALIADINDADAWDVLTTETRNELVKLGATFGETLIPTDDDEELAHVMTLGGVSALCGFYNGEHVILRWAANARAALAEGEG